MKDALAIDDPSESELRKANARLSGRSNQMAENASADLLYATHLCTNEELRKRIEDLQRDLDTIVYPTR